jgi:Ca2+-binding EF-hand superfamily protein
MDDDGSKSLNRMEFEKACKDFKIDITQQDIGTLFAAFDANRDGTIQYDEFLRTIRGELSGFRRKMVESAFKKLDRDGSGIVDAREIADTYNAKKHPAVIDGRKTEE